MMQRFLVGALVLFCCIGTASAQKDKTKKDKATKDKEPPYTVGKVLKVDESKGTITIALKTGRSQTFSVDDKTKILGPRGGVSKKRLKDDRLAPGYEVKILTGRSKTKATEVKLAYRKRAPKPEKDKKPAKDKPTKDKPKG